MSHSGPYFTACSQLITCITYKIRTGPDAISYDNSDCSRYCMLNVIVIFATTCVLNQGILLRIRFLFFFVARPS
jgi:hypothetical protein